MFARRIVETAWPIVLLLAFLATWRRGKVDAVSQPVGVCDAADPSASAGDRP